MRCWLRACGSSLSVVAMRVWISWRRADTMASTLMPKPKTKRVIEKTCGVVRVQVEEPRDDGVDARDVGVARLLAGHVDDRVPEHLEHRADVRRREAPG